MQNLLLNTFQNIQKLKFNEIKYHKTYLEKLAHRAIFTVQQLLGASHPVGIYQPLEVASEVVVHRIAQVGRIRAENKRILISL